MEFSLAVETLLDTATPQTQLCLVARIVEIPEWYTPGSESHRSGHSQTKDHILVAAVVMIEIGAASATMTELGAANLAWDSMPVTTVALMNPKQDQTPGAIE